MPTLVGQAPAKINLGLKIVGRRPDGYHELRTVFQTISLADRLAVSYVRRRSTEVTLRCNDPALENEDNLAYRAAKDLLAAKRWAGHIKIDLEKRIPHGSGLGGGSSDAAAVLLALEQLLRPTPPRELLFEIAARLGSDVPFFLVGGTAVGIGRGEEVYPLPDGRRHWALVLAPPIRISTADAYRRLRLPRRSSLTVKNRQPIIDGFYSRVCASERGGLHGLAAVLPNDFEDVIFQAFPDLQQWKSRLSKAGAFATMMCGSGAALFGLFSDRRSAIRARDSLRGFSGDSYAVRTLSRRSYRRLWSSSDSVN